MPTTTARTLTRLAAAILLPCHFGNGALASETEQYPIWWSPSLELESLDKIDERRRKRFWPERHDGVRVYKAGDTSTEPAEIDDCWTLEHLPDEGYSTPIENDNRFIESLSRVCTELNMLEGAKTAEVSYVRDFVMTAKALDYLPAMVHIAPGCDYLCRQYRANERRIPLSRFEAEFDVETKVRSELKVEGKTDWFFYDVEILARADFNHDGLEDLLVIASVDATEGTWAATSIFLLNRDTSDSVFWVMDADEYLNPDYQCQEHYDEPAALR